MAGQKSPTLKRFNTNQPAVPTKYVLTQVTYTFLTVGFNTNQPPHGLRQVTHFDEF